MGASGISRRVLIASDVFFDISSLKFMFTFREHLLKPLLEWAETEAVSLPK